MDMVTIRQAVLKLDSFIGDMYDLSYDTKNPTFEEFAGYAAQMLNHLMVIATEEISEEEFLKKQWEMDDIELFTDDAE